MFSIFSSSTSLITMFLSISTKSILLHNKEHNLQLQQVLGDVQTEFFSETPKDRQEDVKH